MKEDLERLWLTALESGASLALFGHTHRPLHTRKGTVELLNPGSVGRGRRSWGLITVKGTEFKCKLMDA